MLRVNFALMEAVAAQKAAERAARPVLHPLAEFYGDWERAMRREPDAARERSVTVSLTGDEA